jgi:hypothetical protein
MQYWQRTNERINIYSVGEEILKKKKKLTTFNKM